MSFALVTAIFGGYEPLFSLPPGVHGICFTDGVNEASGWHLRRLRKPQLSSPRLQNRYVKTQLHRLVDADVTLYVDGAFKIGCEPEAWALEALGSADFAAYQHPRRDCVYAEADACVEERRGDPDAIALQVERYRAAGLPDHSGLYGGGILVRRRTAAAAAFGDAWWAELAAGSDRDQLSLGFLVWLQRFPLRVIPGNLYKPPFAQYRGHKRKRKR